MGNQLNKSHSRNSSSNSHLQIQKIKLLVIGYIRLYIKENGYISIPVLVETVCSKYYGDVLINCIFQCKIDRYGYLISIDKANKFDEKAHRIKLRNESTKLISWQQYLFHHNSTRSKSLSSLTSLKATLSNYSNPQKSTLNLNNNNIENIPWHKILNTSKLRSLVQTGIPEPFRPILWKKFLQIDTIRNIAIENYGANTLFQDIVNSNQSPFHEDIWRDINKTNKNHVNFGLYNYSKEINNITPNNDELYELNEEDDISPFQRNNIHRRRRANRRTRSAKRLSLNARSAILSSQHQHQQSQQSISSKQKKRASPQRSHSMRSASNSDIMKLTSKYKENNKLCKSSSYSQLPSSTRKYSVTYFKHKVIDADTINRCGNRNVNISDLQRNATKTQLQLYNVLKAFSLYQRNIGYTSNCGLSVIAGLLLLYMNEEEVFWFLNGLCDENEKYKMMNLWKPTMPDMKLRLFQMERLIERHLSKLSNHFHANRIVSASMFYAQNWFKTLFTKTEIAMLSHETIFRIWDCYFNQGFIVLFKFGLGILKYNECKLLKCNTMDDIIEILRDDANEINVDGFVKISMSFKITQSYLDKLRSKFY